MTQPHEVVFASKQYQDWLAALKDKAMLATHNQAQAMMRAVLQELRDCVSDDDALAIADALPPLPRGIMLEGWRLGGPQGKIASPEDFHRRLRKTLEKHHEPPDDLAEAAFAVWREALPPIEAEKIRTKLPEALKPLWNG